MRFTAKEIKNGEFKGKWAVFHGNKFWRNSVGVKEFAQQQAAIQTMNWHQEQMDKCWGAVMKASSQTNKVDGVKLVKADGTFDDSNRHFVDKGDCSC